MQIDCDEYMLNDLLILKSSEFGMKIIFIRNIFQLIAVLIFSPLNCSNWVYVLATLHFFGVH